MTAIGSLIRRDMKLFFKDKGMFFSALITPIILLVLYITFLSAVYKDAFSSAMPAGFSVDESLINATVASQLISSLLAVSCVTVSFCANLLMVQDKITGARKDLTVTPVKKSVLSLGYFLATEGATLIIAFVAMLAGFIYIGNMGWYMSSGDVVMLMLDILLITLFGTALSSVINCNLSTQGQASAVGTIVSAGYGFICGAYMPLSGFSEGLRKAMGFLPGTYGTSLIRNHCMAGVFREMLNKGFPKEVVEGIKDSVDCNLYFNGDKVGIPSMYMILGGAIAGILIIYIIINIVRKNNK